jgi:hypothetical protein
MTENKKKGRKKKVDEKEEETNDENILKKRGRKPKGGKLIQNTDITVETAALPVNIILHLKCYIKDLDFQPEVVIDPLSYNPTVPPEIMSYDTTQPFSYYSEQLSMSNDDKLAYTDVICKKCSQQVASTEESVEDDSISLKDIHQKLRKLRTKFYKNTLNDKKSACFWCTYDFDNEPCYIPKYEISDTISGYGCFCRPECAVGFLMNEQINDSTKFERYQILNQIYSKVYDFKKNIKPAPSPFYLLDKFYGSLSIQEYRKLLKTEHMLLILDKPLTRILPELHDDNDEFILNIYGGVKTNQGTSSGQYKVKRQSEKSNGPTKNSIMKEKFGMS